ncbi:hypothetical protein AG1IA_00700 [Rhizoctonia solani AG-1 IA]|uniref:Uncharacterized protein n=1 Tax=Thanatephorus cucumeris (strain AG1-IA) TaxID=983506 RepID=L8X867_THACA|nr:hypothetical protein AG1IA_00700 [Rhizoctonia solani AG-1 IA]
MRASQLSRFRSTQGLYDDPDVTSTTHSIYPTVQMKSSLYLTYITVVQTMYSRTTATRAFTCRRLFPTVKSTIVKRSVPAITQSSGSLFTTLHSASHLPVLRYTGRSQLRHYAASTGVEEDPERKGLYYHPVGDNIFALSFLKEKPVNKSSATVIGLVKGGEESNSFQENRELLEFPAV